MSPFRHLLVVMLCITGFTTFGSAQDSIKIVPTISIDSLDLVALEAEDSLRDAQGLAPRFAVPHDVSITPATHGHWEKINDDVAMWRLRVTCKNAISMNFGFERWMLPIDSEMLLYNVEGTHKVRPFTIDDYSDSGELWTPVLAGGDVIIEIRCPQNAEILIKEEIKLTRINPGYRGFHENFGTTPTQGNFPSLSGSCNVDVACPESVTWENEIDCVGVISTGGSTFCTGFMVNNTSQDGTPYFMTADHCGLSAGNSPSLVVYWNYENSFCRAPGSAASGGAGNGTLNQFSSGAVFRAGSGTSDFTLVELNSPPNAAFGVSFCGWDASSAAPTSAVGIHHPATDEKRISFENQAPSLSTNFVTVNDWDLGTTEPGSSGSPLFDQNHRVIGQLCCGGAACGNNLSDDYGRFSRSWTLGLSAWLDSAGTGSLFVDTLPAGGGGGPIELCSNGVDDDSDGLTDCADPDCASSPACGGGGGGGAPANDDCANATAVGEGSFAFDNSGSIIEGPTDCDTNMGTDVWFAYTATSSGTATIETCGTAGSLDDSVLIVYDGSAGCPSAGSACLSSDDDGCTAPNFSSTVALPVVAGNTYLIQCGGWNGATGSSDLTISVGGGPAPTENCTNGVDDDGDGLADCDDPDCAAVPVCGGGGGGNDDCANATPVGEGLFAVDNTNSILDGPTDCDTNMGTDVWFEYTASASGTATIETCGSLGSMDDTVLIVYDGAAGCPVVGSACLASDDDGCTTPNFNSTLAVPVTAGGTYLVQVGGWNGATGTTDLSISLGGGPAPTENCTNGTDDDGDGLVDCVDPDCANNPACGGGGGGYDECSGALQVFDGANAFDTSGFTNSLDPLPTGCTGGGFGGLNNDGWFAYTATASGTATFNTCDALSFDTDLAVYAGTCGALALLGCDGDGSTLAGCQGFDSEVAGINVIAGETYLVRLGGFGTADAGAGTLTITIGGGGGGGGGGGNDDCANATPVGEGLFAVDNTNSILDGPTDCDANMNTDVWFEYTASASGTATIETCGSLGSMDDTVLIVYDGAAGCPVAGSACLASDDDGCTTPNFSSTVAVPVTAGGTYLVQVGGWNGATGTSDLSISLGGGPAPTENCTNGVDDDGDGLIDCADADCAGDPACGGGGTGPANDDCANAQLVGEGLFALDNTNSILDGPTDCDTNMGTDVWFEYTASASGTATIETCGSLGSMDDTVLIVYDGAAGCPVAGSACLASDDDGCTTPNFSSTVAVPVTAGGTYLVQVGGWNGATGTSDLSISLGGGPAPTENCANGVDDDGDGLIDCEDADCDLDPACIAPPVENCTNGTDDDGDGLADCLDSDCANDPSCVTSGFSLIADDATVTYSPDTGVGSFAATVSVSEDSTSAGYPNNTQGFSFGIAHDSGLLSVGTFAAGTALSGLNSGTGPDFLDINTYSDGLTCGCVFSFSSPGTITLQFTSQTALGTIDYDTIPSGLIGNTTGTSTSLSWSNALGAPPVINIMVVGGQANPAALVDGIITLEAGVGGFVRGDVNDDAGINIADAVALLAGLFTGGAIPCNDSADANDDSSVNIADGVYILANLFSGGPGMPAPSGPSCGSDPTSDALDCANYTSCP